MTNRGEAAVQAAHDVRGWVTSDRIRLFGTAGAAAFVVMTVLLLLPGLAGKAVALVVGVLAIVLALLAVATWWAERNGTTDSADLWDSGPSDNATASDVLAGFGFTEDGAQPVDHPQQRS